jgi:hypothetical protein
VDAKKKVSIPSKSVDETTKLSDHPACGMWKDREDMKDPAAYIRKLRQPRYTWDDALGVVRSER